MTAQPALLSMVDESIGIYGTAPTCYLSALARSEDFALADLDRAIADDRSLVRTRVMRYSVYTVPLDLLAVGVAATRGVAKRTSTYRRRLEDDYPVHGPRVEDALSGGPLTSTEIRAQVDPERSLGELFGALLGMLAADCRIVRAPTTAGWRSDRLTWARWRDWLPGVDPSRLEPDEANRRLAQRYVAAYGPVELEDLRWWVGWRKAEAAEAADGLDLGAEGVALRRLDGVRLLPVWDVLMVAYRNRDRLLDSDHARFVYDRSGNATSVVLDEGRVVGIWDLGRSDDPLSIRVAPLGAWLERRWDDVELQAGRIGTMIGAERVEVIRCDEPVDLVRAPRQRFLSPLSG